MKEKSIIMKVALIGIATFVICHVEAQHTDGKTIFTNSTLPIIEVTEATNCNYNFKSFEIETSEPGSYFTEFWLLPTKFADGSYSTFWVYLNDQYIGTINPSVGNWQSARIDGHETLNLIEGRNVITVATLSPDSPEVETIKVASLDNEARFSSNVYNEYLDNANHGQFSMSKIGEKTIYKAESSSALLNIDNVPLYYTFYKTFSFTKDQEITISTSSKVSHKLDIVYYGSLPKDINNPQPHNSSKNQGNTSNIQFAPIDPGMFDPYCKYRIPYTPATPEEMQGLSWVFPSEKAINSSEQLAICKLKIPKTGQYLIRVRHTENESISVADVNVDGKYFYENIPISLSFVQCSIPADGNLYTSYTKANKGSGIDPFLFKYQQ